MSGADFAKMARRMGGAFEEVLIKDIIPMVEKNYRVIADSEHRAMAGLSMGGMQTHGITLNNPTTFAYVGIFSGGTIGAEELTDVPDFKKTNKVSAKELLVTKEDIKSLIAALKSTVFNR